MSRVRDCQGSWLTRVRDRSAECCSSASSTSPALADLLAEVRASSQGRLVLLGGRGRRREDGVAAALLRLEAGDVAMLCGARVRRSNAASARAAGGRGRGDGRRARARSSPGAARPRGGGALLRELRGRGPDGARARGPALGRRGDARRARLAGARGSHRRPRSCSSSYRDDELDRTHQLRVVLGELVRRPATARSSSRCR